MSINSKMTAIADAIRSKTGNTAKLSLDTMAEAIAGIKVGGDSNNGITIGENTNIPNFLNLFYALENGTAVTGEFTFANFLPNTETLVFDSGLSEIKGIFYVDCDHIYNSSLIQTPEYSVWGLYMTHPSDKNVICCGTSPYLNDGYNVNRSIFVTRATYSIVNGALYVKANYNNHATYTPFYAGHRYKWIAW